MSHPCHQNQIKSLKRIEGQVRGVQSMIEDGKYCVDILNQIKAVRAAMTTVEGNILKKHLHECVKDSLNSGDSFDEKVNELVRILKR